MAQIFSKNLYSSSKLIMLAFVAIMMVGGLGCKSKKKAGDVSDTAAEKQKMEQEARERERIEEEAEEARRRAEEERRLEEERAAKKEAPTKKLDVYFNAIANASSVTSANRSIEEALTMFSSPDTPVLIIISEYNGKKDYDKPTTIKEYLNYLKDQKKSANKIELLEFDELGKIKTLELVKHQ